MTKICSILWNDHLKIWEVWYQSRPVAHARDRTRCEEFAKQHGFKVAAHD
jgi:hypothetical protein